MYRVKKHSDRNTICGWGRARRGNLNRSGARLLPNSANASTTLISSSSSSSYTYCNLYTPSPTQYLSPWLLPPPRKPALSSSRTSD
ncbi:hypothetical protein BDN70DRAFT_130010 [Pholiota conissans]|uniref:Uncharacterized protein n=1 Tax=Pholiota conissans TaxID=109636 RepID=A0A9P5Z006_9AGAR|nr:hypothetical protein BDN70DRAFT_130010 [Pholiota conissans]